MTGPALPPRVADRPRPLFVAILIAIVLGGTALMLAGYLAAVKHFHWRLPAAVQRVQALRPWLIDSRTQHLLQAIADQDDDQGVFQSIWDTNQGALLSKRMFRPVEMYSVTKYMYKPNLRKIMFRAGPIGFDDVIETEDTPAIRAALQGVTADWVAASYDDLGFRHVDPELSAACTSSAVFLGDSFTDGMWVSDRETFVNRYGHLVRERAGQPICPVDMGVNGYGSLEEAWVFEHYADRVPPPKIVFLMYFPNDVDEDYAAVVDGTVPDGPAKWEASLGYVRRAIEFARARGIIFVLVAIPPAEQVQTGATRAHYQDILRRFAETARVPFIDLLERFEATDHRGLYWDWDPHFTPRGHALVADLLFDATAAMLR